MTSWPLKGGGNVFSLKIRRGGEKRAAGAAVKKIG